jgi:vancomycin resistance protein YoaR
MTRVLIVLCIVLLTCMMVILWLLGPGMDTRFIPGVWVGSLSLGGMTMSEAENSLQAAVPLHKETITLIGPEGQHWSYPLADLGMSVDVVSSLDKAFAVGHTTEGFDVFSDRINIMVDGVRLSPVLHWNPSVVVRELMDISQDIERPSKNATVSLQGTDVVLDTSNLGRRMEITETLYALVPALYNLESMEYVIPTTEFAPNITDEIANRAVSLAETMLEDPLVLMLANPESSDPGPWEYSRDILAQMLIVQFDANSVWVGLDETELTGILGPIALALSREPVDATFKFDRNTITMTPITQSITGRELDVGATVLRINEQLRAGDNHVPLVIHEIPPAMPDTLTAVDLGIKELVAVGESYFTGSSSARDRNIRLGASRFDGILIEPGQIFSFNEYLGEVTASAGYDESYVIIGDRTVPGVGGGICQVATTAFRAAFYGGYPIVERWPHAYRVGYYEIGGFGPGFDATVYSPYVDFKFKNDTPHYILIETEVDAASARLRFLFYSTDEGWQVEKVGPEWGGSIPSGPPVYEYDETLPAGTVRKLESAHSGLSATLGRIVRDADGNTLMEDTFVSNFVPWPARYIYGPGYVPPSGAVVITPEP